MFAKFCTFYDTLKLLVVVCSLLEMVGNTNHDNYVKLVVSSLDYSRNGVPRVILSKSLTAASDVSAVSASLHFTVHHYAQCNNI